jgi:beta-lactamase regulating signal transducer with metallopeptidase domain
MNTQHSPHSNRSNADRWLKAIGAIVVLWAAAKIIGSILTPGMVLLAIALWLIVRANKKRKAQPQPIHQPGLLCGAAGLPASHVSTTRFTASTWVLDANRSESRWPSNADASHAGTNCSDTHRRYSYGR